MANNEEQEAAYPIAYPILYLCYRTVRHEKRGIAILIVFLMSHCPVTVVRYSECMHYCELATKISFQQVKQEAAYPLHTPSLYLCTTRGIAILIAFLMPVTGMGYAMGYAASCSTCFHNFPSLYPPSFTIDKTLICILPFVRLLPYAVDLQ